MAPTGRVLLLTLLLVASACYRSAQLPGGPGTAAPLPALRVENQTGQLMVVSYQDGHGTGMLGSVRAGESQRFVLSGAPAGEISVSARNADGSASAGPFRVRLEPGATARLVLQP